jgi:hypothetical protein
MLLNLKTSTCSKYLHPAPFAHTSCTLKWNTGQRVCSLLSSSCYLQISRESQATHSHWVLSNTAMFQHTHDRQVMYHFFTYIAFHFFLHSWIILYIHIHLFNFCIMTKHFFNCPVQNIGNSNCFPRMAIYIYICFLMLKAWASNGWVWNTLQLILQFEQFFKLFWKSLIVLNFILWDSIFLNIFWTFYG